MIQKYTYCQKHAFEAEKHAFEKMSYEALLNGPMFAIDCMLAQLSH
jgi:hypothetical protein